MKQTDQLQLEQKDLFVGRQKFTLDKNNIFVSLKSFHNENDFMIPLICLHPIPNRFKQNHIASIIGFLFCGVIAIIFSFAMIKSRNSPNVYVPTVFTVVFYILALIFIIQFLKTSKNKLIYFNAQTGQPSLIFLVDKPSPTSFNNFQTILQQNINYLHEHHVMEGKKYIADEIKKLDSLQKEGIIKFEEFYNAKESLLGIINDMKRSKTV